MVERCTGILAQPHVHGSSMIVTIVTVEFWGLVGTFLGVLDVASEVPTLMVLLQHLDAGNMWKLPIKLCQQNSGYSNRLEWMRSLELWELSFFGIPVLRKMLAMVKHQNIDEYRVCFFQLRDHHC